MTRLLFICTANKFRSKTAETIFSERPGYEVKSAGTDALAPVPLSRELLEWADVILVMESKHRNFISRKFKDIYASRRIHILNIPDEFDYMEPALVNLLKGKVGAVLGS